MARSTDSWRTSYAPLVARATARKLGTTLALQHGEAQATEGWNLESRGYVPHAVLMRRVSAPPRQEIGRAHV